MRRTMKPAVAVMAAAALLVLLAAPSGAQTGTVTAGTLTVTGFSPLAFPLAGTPPCAGSTLDVALSSPAGGAVTFSLPQGAFDYGTPNAHVLVVTAAGTASMSPGTGGTGSFAISGSIAANATTHLANIYARTGDCTPTTTKRCGPIVTTITFTGTFTGTVGTTAPYTLTGTAVVSGSGTLSAFGCAAPFSIMNGKQATITNMTVDF
ncbi:MAG TPA: hypothetical protein VF228_22680 [Iamia sp.]